jgi:hypothetical protein
MAPFVAGQVAARQTPERPTAVPLAEASAARSGRVRLPRWLAAVSPWFLLVACALFTLLTVAWFGVATLLARAPAEAGTTDEETAVAAPVEESGATTPETAADPAGLGAAPPGATPPGAAEAPAEETAPPGRPALLMYDGGSFYLWNPGPESITISHAAFEAVDAAGVPAGFRFDGGNWAAYFPRVEPGKCVSIEIWRRAHLRPAQCQGYNAVVSPQETAPTLFWLPRDNTPHFRLLWHDQEIARCPTAPPAEAGTPRQCEVFMP